MARIFWVTCPHCEGTGLMRTASSAGLSALRMLEEEAARGRGSRIASVLRTRRARSCRGTTRCT